MMYISEVIIMLEKNRQKKERAARRQTFVGVRPARFKKKTAYDRKAQKNDTRAQINGDQSQLPRDGRFNFIQRLGITNLS